MRFSINYQIDYNYQLSDKLSLLARLSEKKVASVLHRRSITQPGATRFAQAVCLRAKYGYKKGGPREEVLELPEPALREAVVNAIAHRDYFSTAHIQVNIFSDRVEITNPGGLPADLSLKEIIGRSIPRNPLLFGLMQRMDLVEEVGSGLLRINKALKEYNMAEPAIEADKNWFTITFPRPDLQKSTIQERIEAASEGLVEGLVESQRKIIELIARNNKISKRELAEKIGISTTAIDKNISALKNKGLLRRIGSPKGGHWEIIEKS